MSSKRAFVGVSVAFGLLLGAATSSAVTEAKPTDLSTECISPDAAKALSECPAGKMADVHSKRPAAFSSAPPPRDVKKRHGRLQTGQSGGAHQVRRARHAQEPLASPRSRPA